MDVSMYHWKKMLFRIIPAVLGLGGGLAYWWWVGCTPEGCALTGNPYLMGGFGALFGWSLGDDIHRFFQKRKK